MIHDNLAPLHRKGELSVSTDYALRFFKVPI